MSWRATLLGCLASTALVMAALAWATDGFTLLTAEEARRRSVARETPALIPLTVQSPSGDIIDWRDAIQHDGRVAVLHFVYTRCRTLCSIQSAQTRAMQRQLVTDGLQHKVRLMTVSFDPARDTPEVLASFAQRLGALPELWTVWRAPQPQVLAQALKSLGIVLIEEDNGEFVHNAAWMVIDAQARLRAIVPQESPMRALRMAQAVAKQGEGE